MTNKRTPTTIQQQIYDTDFVKWVDNTAELLRQGRLDELDIENLIEEVEDLGRSQKQAFTSNLRILLMHLLKWQYQPSKRSGSWKGSIREHRDRIQDALKDSPSLKNFYIASLENSYIKARKRAADETGLPLEIFPIECTYSKNQIIEEDFLPEE